jgi:hypothetical protein
MKVDNSQMLSRAALTIAAATTILCGAPDRATASSPPSLDIAEKHRYEVSFSDARLATVRLRTACPDTSRSTPYIPAVIYAFSQGFASKVHSFVIRLDSFMSTSRDRSYEGRTRITEEGETRRFKSRFRKKPSVETLKTWAGGEKTYRQNVSLPGPGHDLISWLYELRDVPSLTAGDRHTFYVWDGWKLVRLVATVEERSRVSTPMGTFHAFPVELVRTRLHHEGAKRFKPREDAEKLGTVWLRDDRYRRPVAMHFHSPIGTVKIRLEASRVRSCKKKKKKSDAGDDE